MERDVTMKREKGVKVCRCVENIWRMYAECNCVKIDVTMYRDEWMCR